MRIRIKSIPVEREVDGVKLSSLIPGTVRNVSSALGLWLIAEGYAQPEMREESRDEAADPAVSRATIDDLQRRYPDRRKRRS